MSVTATEFRKNLFRLLDEAALGNEIEITHKGTLLRVSPAIRGSRLSRLIVRDGVDLDPTASGWDAAARAEWDAEQKALLGE